MNAPKAKIEIFPAVIQDTSSAHRLEISAVVIIVCVSREASCAMEWTTVEMVQMRPTVVSFSALLCVSHLSASVCTNCCDVFIQTMNPHVIKTSSSAPMANASAPTCVATFSTTVKIMAQMRWAARRVRCCYLYGTGLSQSKCKLYYNNIIF